MASLPRISIVAALLLCSVSAFASQRSSANVGINNLSAPVPTPLLNGKKAFISYEIGDITDFPGSYSGGPERAYSEMMTAMKAWGRYQIVMDPKDADVIFSVRFVDPPNVAPQIRLSLSDARTHVALWGFVEQVDFAFRKKNRDLAFTDTVKQLITDVQTLLAPTVPPPVAP